ncbi:MAG: hypothetical protein K9H48_12270 [Melioribacteraceae bacterium]|nr:hypothetical protein [Melioribacteraceae bacterium]MCF8395082.1 hypothetical protein [Melioribacteraceae bacterium]MCF8420371.1 hypothetical protein [Melioribacteraceae bacterium]
MKNKNLRLILFSLVIVIWGFVIFRILSYYEKNGSASITKSDINIDKDFNEIIPLKDSIQFLRLKRDPFKISPKEKDDVKKNIHPKVTQSTKREELMFSINGVIINHDSKLVVINVENSSELIFLKEGEKYKSIKITGIFDDKVEYLYRNSRKTITIY